MEKQRTMTDELPAISSWSGGKDSCLACYQAMKAGYEVKYLLHFVSRETGRGCFHGIEDRLMRLQAQCIGIPLIQRAVGPDMDEYKKEFKSAVGEMVKGKGIKSMVFGDVYLDEHKSWVDRVCGEIGIEPVQPLWGRNPGEIIEDFINAGFKAIVVSCKADLLGREFAGKPMDRDLLGELKAKKICPCGENGEFHTFVIDGPIFQKAVRITKSRPVLKEGFWKHWFLDIEEYG